MSFEICTVCGEPGVLTPFRRRYRLASGKMHTVFEQECEECRRFRLIYWKRDQQ